ncbi:capsule biosynthesis protein [Roseicella aquatilis]|uniref:Capsule biosynthesis protein n=1 Tax=Roseicella aquatilis TaxID=2527868 RepID=A0A4R4DLG7_9PROT|nr:capsule biosynthesis protein [Roseicella aquatilis]
MFFRRNTFKMTVLLPTLLAALYLYGVAAPQYESEARFLVRGRSGGGSGGGGMSEMMASAGFKPASEDAMGVRDYLESHDAVDALRHRLPLVEIFRRPEADPLARLWWSNPTSERLLDYFRRMATAEYDTTSGISTLRVRSFRPEDSKAIAGQLLTLSEELVNRLNRRMQEDGLRVAQEDLTRAEARVTAAQLAMAGFREREKALDPARSAALAVDTIGQLEGSLAQARAELSEVQRFARSDNPRVTQLRNRIEGLTGQIADQRRRLGSREEGVSQQQFDEYERLSVERDLARAHLASATASLERARSEALRQQLFLMRVVEPNLAEYARYPKSTLSVIYVFACLSVLYGLAWLLIAGMREHAS